MKLVLVGLLLCVSSFAFVGPRLEEDPFTQEWRFVGCRPTVSECRYSCPSGKKYGWKINSDQCEYPEEPIACFCHESDNP